MKRVLFALLLTACVAPCLWAQKAPSRPVLFKVSKIYVGNDKVISPGMVLVKNGKIVAVGKSIDVPNGTTRVERPGWTLTPGLIDAAAEGFANSTEGISEVIPGFKVADGLNLSSKYMKTLATEGVTTAFVTASGVSVIGCQGAIVKTGQKARILSDHGDPKLTISHSATAGNRGPSRFGSITVFTRRPTSQMGVIFVARDALTKAQEYVRAKKNNPAIKQDVHLDILADVLAGKRQIRFRGEKQYELSAGLRLAEEFGLKPIFENSVEAWRVIDSMKRTSAAGVFGPIIPASASVVVSRFRRPPAPPRMNPKATQVLVDAGLTLALTAGSGSGERGLARQVSYAMRHGLSQIEAVKAVTSVPAALLGIEKNVGLIKVGYDADFVLWTGEPFAATSRQGIVFIDGVVVDGKTF